MLLLMLIMKNMNMMLQKLVAEMTPLPETKYHTGFLIPQNLAYLLKQFAIFIIWTKNQYYALHITIKPIKIIKALI